MATIDTSLDKRRQPMNVTIVELDAQYTGAIGYRPSQLTEAELDMQISKVSYFQES